MGGVGSKEKGRKVDVGHEDDLGNNEMKEVDLGEGAKCLLVKTKRGEIYATGHKCTHYGAPMVKGVLCDDRVMCPWHAACFDVKTGDIEDAPALDGIHSFPVSVEGGRVFVSVPEKFPDFKRTEKMCTKVASDARLFVIVGGGAAGVIAAETLRQEGFTGRVVMITNEDHLPYDRIKLSKSFSVSVDSILLRSQEFFDEHNIEVWTGKEVTEVDPNAKTVTLADGQVVKYDKCVVATGGFPRTLPCEGHDLDNIHTLRYPSDAASINTASTDVKKAVVVGSSFIGMEAAALLKQMKKVDEVVVVGMEKVPFERVLGSDIGAAMQKLHESKGISFRMERTVKKFEGSGKVSAVVLDNDERIEADVVVIGAGIICATKFLKGVTLERDGSVIVDEHFETPIKDLYVAGDIARFKYWQTGETIRIEHWDVAMQHGRIVGRNMSGMSEKFDGVPFFWTQQFGANLRYAGNAMSWDEIIFHGDLAANKFVAYFVKGDKVTAVCTMGSDPAAVAASELLRVGKMPSGKELKGKTECDLKALLA